MEHSTDNNNRLVEGYGTVEIIDNQGDYVPTELIYNLMPTYMKRGGILVDAHTNRHIGRIISWERRQKDEKDSIYLWAEIFDDFTIDDMVWDAIKKKHYTGFSFGGRGIDKKLKCNTDKCYQHVQEMEMWEWSVVPKPANKESVISKFNDMAKGCGNIRQVFIPHITGEGSVEYSVISIGNDGIVIPDELQKQENEQSSTQSGETDEKLTKSDEISKCSDKEESTMPEEGKTDKTEEMSKEGEAPAIPPAEEDSNPLNQVMAKLEEIEQRLTTLESPGEEEKAEKAELDEPPKKLPKDVGDEEEKAESVKTVTTPEPPAQQEDKELGNETMTKQMIEAMGTAIGAAVSNEFKKMGFSETATPRPAIDTSPPAAEKQPTFGDMMKGDDNKINIHAALADKTFTEIDDMAAGIMPGQGE